MNFARFYDQNKDMVGVVPTRVSAVYAYVPKGEHDPHEDCRSVVTLIGGEAYWVREEPEKCMDIIEKASVQ